MVSYSEREWWIDYAKVIGIFLVVFIHLIQVSFNELLVSDRSILLVGTAFFMPLFFFVSGYLYKYTPPKDTLKKYFKRLVIPYIFFTLVGILSFVIYKKLFLSNTIVKVTGKFLVGMILTEPYNTITLANGTIWFLIALFNIIIIFTLLKRYLKQDKYIFLIILGFNLLLYVLHILNINLYFGIDNALLGILFFYTGHLAKKHDLINYFKNNYSNIAIAIIFFILTFLEYKYNGVLGLRSASWTGNFILCYFGAFTGIIMTIALSCLLAKFKNKLIFLISINTLTIMGLEQFLRLYTAVFLKHLGIKNVYPFLIVIILSIVILIISVAIAMILNKYAPVLIGNPSKVQNKETSNTFQKLYLVIKNKRNF
jgi:fucose 4-O-acetylase-like acetyltransferase